MCFLSLNICKSLHYVRYVDVTQWNFNMQLKLGLIGFVCV